MRLKNRVREIERKRHPEEKEPRFVIVLEDEDWRWHGGRGNAIDPAAVGPWVRVIRLVTRPDGPQYVPTALGRWEPRDEGSHSGMRT